MEPVEALAQMHGAAVLWSVGQVSVDALVDAACHVLLAGFDGLDLAILAGIHAQHADDWEVPELLEAALNDVGLSYYPRGSRAGQEAAVEVMASRVLTGLMPPRDLTAWAHSTFGHGTLPLAECLVELDDFRDTLIEEDTDDEILAEASRIVGTTATKVDPVSPPSTSG